MPRVIITVPDKNAQPYRFQLDRDVVTLGRGSENDIAIDSGSVSVHHAEMRRIEGGYELHDVGSTNGIKRDGLRQEMIPLRNGATVKIGDVSFDFSLTDEELAALAREKVTEPSPITREAELPALPPKSARSRAASSADGSDGPGFGTTLVFIIFAAIAFFAGLAVRHQKETGNSLLDDIKVYRSGQAAPVAPAAPAEPPVK